MVSLEGNGVGNGVVHLLVHLQHLRISYPRCTGYCRRQGGKNSGPENSNVYSLYFIVKKKDDAEILYTSKNNSRDSPAPLTNNMYK